MDFYWKKKDIKTKLFELLNSIFNDKSLIKNIFDKSGKILR